MKNKHFQTTFLLFLLAQLVVAQTEFVELNNSGLQSFSKNEGIAVGDFNNDGWEDLYVSSPQGLNRLCKNNGDGTFTEMAIAAGIIVDAQSVASTWGDLNNDGFLDLYVSVVSGKDQLFLNNGDETFTDISLQAGIFNNALPKAVNMADVNNDGWLDIYVTNFLSDNVLYINSGNTTFFNQNNLAGANDTGFSMGSIFFDYDKDGDLDLYLVHDQLEPNFLYQNDGTGVFTEVSEAAGVNGIGNGMGVDVGDFNNDGWSDIYVTNLFQNFLFQNNQDGTFSEISQSAGVNDNGMGWGTSFVDFDKDGLVDIYVANESDFFSPPDPNVLYKNMGNNTFEKVETDGEISNVHKSFAAVCFDYDQDGNVDIAVANKGDDEHLQLFQNVERAGTWVGIKLLGVETNRNGIGSKIQITDNLGQLHYKELTAGHGWASQNSNILTFGLGAATSIENLTIFWASGLVQEVEIENLEKNYTITEGFPAQEGIVYELSTAVHNNKITKNNLLNIFPNPHHGNFTATLDLPQSSKVEITIFNFLGEQVFFEKIENLPAGKQKISFAKNDFPALTATQFLTLQVKTETQQFIKKMFFQMP